MSQFPILTSQRQRVVHLLHRGLQRTVNLRFLVDVMPSVVDAPNMLVYMRTGMGWNPAQESTSPKEGIPTPFIHGQREKWRGSIAPESSAGIV
jgi:hypothetical protein